MGVRVISFGLVSNYIFIVFEKKFKVDLGISKGGKISRVSDIRVVLEI